MKYQVLTPDMDATTEVDPIRLALEANASLAAKLAQKADASEKVDAVAAMEETRKELEGYEDPGVRIKIGFLPVAKKTDLETWHTTALAGWDKGSPLTLEQMRELTEITRETVRWGVRGHNIDKVPFHAEGLEYRGRHYDLCPLDVLEVYELNGWLHLLREQILLFNALGPEKKEPSSSSAGTHRAASTAKCAETSPN